MTTSGTTAWTVTAGDIIKTAMGPILDPGADPEAGEMEDCLVHLNGLLKSWQGRGVGLSHQATGTITTAPGDASGTIDGAIRSISSAWLVVSATQDRPLFPIDRTQYLRLPNKVQVGSPTMFYFSRQRDAPELHLWPVSATAATIRIDYDRIVETVTALTETIDIRAELFEAVWTNLATMIAPAVFGVPCPPKIEARAQILEAQMLDAERPDVYRFETDYDYA